MKMEIINQFKCLASFRNKSRHQKNAHAHE